MPLSNPSTVVGQELSYVEITSPVTISATSEATADTVVTAGAITFDGSTRVCIEFFSDSVAPGATAASAIAIFLYDGASSIGYIWFCKKDSSATAQNGTTGCHAVRYLTPSAGSHTYSIRASRSVSNGSIYAGAGGSGNDSPAFIRISRA